MNLQSNLIESNKQKDKGGWRASTASIGVHGLLVAFVVYMGAQATQKVNAEHQIKAFIAQGAAPPPPPPPPPPAASSAPKATPKIVQPKPVVVPQFHQPTEIPKELPKVDPIPTTPVQV